MGRSSRKRAASPEEDTPPAASSKRRHESSSPLKERLVRYEMKFAENEIVVALSDTPATQDPKEKYWLGRLLQDVLLGDDNEDNVKIRWFEYEEEEEDPDEGGDEEGGNKKEKLKKKAKAGDSNTTSASKGIVVLEGGQEEEEPEEDEEDDDVFAPINTPDLTPIGSLICAVSGRLVRAAGSEMEPTKWTVPSEVYEYVERKLQEQLDDNYDSENDSQFGDEAVEKRMRLVQRKQKKMPRPGSKKAGGAKKTGNKNKSMGKKKGKQELTPRPFVPSVPNPFTEVKTGRLETFSGDVERTGKEVIRAVRSKDYKALKAALDATDKVHSPLKVAQSVGVPIWPLIWAMVSGDIEATRLLLEYLKQDPGHTIIGKGKARVQLQSCALPTLNTGKQSSRFGRYNRAAINASRGSREGNNALLHDVAGGAFKTLWSFMSSNALPFAIGWQIPECPRLFLMRDFDEIPQDVLDLAEVTFSRDYWPPMALDQMIKGGHVRVLHRCLVKQTSHALSSKSFNFLHVESLATKDSNDEVENDNVRRQSKGGSKKKAPAKKQKKQDAPTIQLFSQPVLARSVCKKSDTDLRFSPLACACINPDTAYLERLLQVAPEHAEILDQKNTSLLHYAAACQGSGPVEFLLNNFPQQSSRTALDKFREMPLHFAARAARPTNILALLKGQTDDEQKVMLTAKTAEGLTPLHLATQTLRKDNLETVRALLEAGADPNAASSAARNKVTAVHLAARMGDLPILKLLLDPRYKGNPSKGDKLGRTPLVHACFNGHAHIVAFLLGEVGVNPETADSSGNRPLHYAAAYGWSECAKLLLAKDEDKEELGDTAMKESDDFGVATTPIFDSIADPDPKNSWKTTPLAVAIQKGRQSVASLLLNMHSVDVNFPDGETGKTLFFRMVEVFVFRTLLSKEAPAFAASKRDEDGGTKALQKEMPWALQRLLDRSDVDVAATAPDSGFHVLHLLCSQQYPAGGSGEERAVALAKLFISRSSAESDGKRGIGIDACDKAGMTPLLHTAVSGNTKLFEFLMSNGASVKANLVDKQGKNVCHHLLSLRAHLPGCLKQLELVESSAGSETEFVKLLEAPDNEGSTALHVAMKKMCSSLSEKEFDRAHQLVKSICSRFPNSVKIQIGATKEFTDPSLLAKIVLGEDDRDEGDNNNGFRSRTRQNRNGKGNTLPTILKGADRVDPKRVRKALQLPSHVVPLESEDVGKTLLHLACESSHPERIHEMLKWLLPAAPENTIIAAGRKNNVRMTPVQTVLREKLPAGRLNRSKPLQNAEDEQKASLSLLLDGVTALLAASEGLSTMGVNDMPKMINEEAGNEPWTAEQDKEAVGDIKRHAEAFLTDAEDTETGQKLVATFKRLMESRGGQVPEDRNGSSSLPLAVVLAMAGSSVVPLHAWDRLIDQYSMSLDSPTQKDTTLLVALRKKDKKLCEYLCTRCPGLLLLANTSSGQCPIHVVAALDDPVFLKLILRHIDSEEAVNQADTMGRTALHLSVAKAACRQEEALEPCEMLLLRAGARVDAGDVLHRTALHYCFLDSTGKDDHYNFPHSLPRTSHDRIDLVSTLLGAAAAGDRITMKSVVNFPDKRGRTPLFYAAAFNSTVSSLLLCSHGADLFHVDQDLNTPVNTAVLRGHDNYAITMLKSMGVSSNLPDLVDVVDVRRDQVSRDDGKAVVKVLSRDTNSIVWHAIKRGFRGLVYILLDSFPLSKAVIDALDNGAFQLVRKLLTTSPQHVVQYVDPVSGRTILHEVADVKRFVNPEWSVTMANILLENGVAAAAVANDGRTSLHIAAARGHVKLTEVLVSHGVSAVMLKDKEGHFPIGSFMRALPYLSLTESNCTCMLEQLTKNMENLDDPEINKVPRIKDEACSISYEGVSFRPGPNLDTVRAEMFNGSGNGDVAAASEPPGSQFSTLLIQAIHSKRFGLMQSLINKGANINQPDSCGLAPIHHAVLHVSLPAVAALLRNNANPDIQTGDVRLLTPLMLATFLQDGEHVDGSGYNVSFEIAKILLRFGADVLPACKQTGQTAMHFAVRENNCRLVELFLKASQYQQARGGEKSSREIQNGEGLVRFGSETALYPGLIHNNVVNVLGPVVESELPSELVTERYEHKHLALDSLERLIELARDDCAAATTTILRAAAGSAEEKRKKLSGGGIDSVSGGGGTITRQDLFGDSSDEESGRAPHDHTGGSFIDDPAEVFSDDDSLHNDTSGDVVCRAKLDAYFGSEALLLGTLDENLTAPFTKGDYVIVQPDGAEKRKYANAKDPWLEGRIASAHPNGTYDVDLIRGTKVSDVLRQQLRPWRDECVTGKVVAKEHTVVADLLTAKDKSGFTCLQAAVTFDGGYLSFENVDLVNLLIDAGAAVDDSTVALARPGSSFKDHLVARMEDPSSVTQEDEPEPLAERKKTLNVPNLEPMPSNAFEADSKAALIALESKGRMKRKNVSPKVNKVCQIKAVGLHVIPVTEDAVAQSSGAPNKKPAYYDVIMVAVEVTHHAYSENKYYKMQILRDPTKELFILLTNWGRVGDSGGQKQETPSSREEAIKEFEKVFKSKTGNQFQDCGTEKFKPVLGKYKPVSVLSAEYERPEVADIAAMVENVKDYPNVQRESALGSPLSETIAALADPKAITAAASTLGFQQDCLPLGRLSIEQMLEAETKLDLVEAALNECKNFRKPEELPDRRAALERVAILSSQYFELIPTREGDQALRPLDQSSLKEQRTKLFALKDLTVASQIVNTASVQAEKTNPLDYTYRALDIHMGSLQPGFTRTGIEQYFRNTCGNNSDLVINEVFSVDRMDEPTNVHFDNHRLLWHGTALENVLAILKEGLRVAPLSAQRTGAAFGEGIYFADEASKSFGYCRANFSSNATKKKPRAYLLLADVALGNQERVTASVYDTDEHTRSFDTVMAVGYEGPFAEKDVTIASSGTTIPLGKSIKNPAFVPRAKWMISKHKEAGENISSLIEAARNSRATAFPTSVRVLYDSKPWDVVLEHGPLATVAKALPVAKKRTKEQPEEGKKRQKSGEDGRKIDRSDSNAIWHYWLDVGMDGKQRGWHPYDESAVAKLEGFIQNKGTRLSTTTWHLQSGYFSYEVDINSMTQRNRKTGTVRPIRRILDGESVSMTEPPSHGHLSLGTVTNNTGTKEDQSMELTRREQNLKSHIRFNEYIVKDVNRINIRFVVEVTSRSWLLNNLKESIPAADTNNDHDANDQQGVMDNAP